MEVTSQLNKSGAYTTFLAQRSDRANSVRIVALSRHMSRLTGNLEELGLITSATKLETSGHIVNCLKHALKNIALEGEGHRSWRVRLSYSADGPEALVVPYVNPWHHTTGIQVCSYIGERSVPHIKSLAQDICLQARRYAETQGCDEALLIDRSGNLREGAWSNIFWFDRTERLFTVGDKVLAGITQGLILEMEKCEQVAIKFSAFCEMAKEVFMTQSTTGITAVKIVDRSCLYPGVTGPLVKNLRARWLQNSTEFEEVLSYD